MRLNPTSGQGARQCPGLGHIAPQQPGQGRVCERPVTARQHSSACALAARNPATGTPSRRISTLSNSAMCSLICITFSRVTI
jgi:hypothetical protein